MVVKVRQQSPMIPNDGPLVLVAAAFPTLQLAVPPTVSTHDNQSSVDGPHGRAWMGEYLMCRSL